MVLSNEILEKPSKVRFPSLVVGSGIVGIENVIIGLHYLEPTDMEIVESALQSARCVVESTWDVLVSVEVAVRFNRQDPFVRCGKRGLTSPDERQAAFSKKIQLLEGVRSVTDVSEDSTGSLTRQRLVRRPCTADSRTSQQVAVSSAGGPTARRDFLGDRTATRCDGGTARGEAVSR
jgi:hypothetical protein